MLIRLLILGAALLLLLVPILRQGAAADATKRAVLHCLAGEELLLAGWLAPARREYEQALRLQPMLGAAHFGLGKVLYLERRYAEAVEEYRAAVVGLHTVRDVLGESAGTAPELLTAALAQALEAERDSRDPFA